MPFTVKAFKSEVLDVYSNGRTTFSLISSNATIQSGVTMASETLTDFVRNEQDFQNGNVNFIYSIPF